MNLDLLRRISGEVDRIEQAIAEGESIAIDELFPDLNGEDRAIAVREIQELLEELSHHPEPLTPTVSASSLSARFEPIEPINHGGMGEIWIAIDHDFDRKVAIKEVLPEAAGNELLRQRFTQEAEITARLEHPGILPIYGKGLHVDGRPYYSMRFISGDGTKSLHQAIHELHSQKSFGDHSIRANPRMGLHDLLQRFIAVCNTVAYAHNAKIVHRDLKPANILLGQFGETFVVDWGLALDLTRQDPQFQDRQISEVVGTLGFVAPELLSDPNRVDRRTDIYSLGVVLYTLCVGSPPFATGNRADAAETKAAILAGKFTRPRHVNPTLHPALEAICLKAMSVESENRYATACELGEDIARYLSDEPTIAWKESWFYRSRRWLQRNLALATSLASALLLTLIGTLIFGWVTHQQRLELSHRSQELRRSLLSETKYKEEAVELAKQASQREALAEEAVQAFWSEVANDPQLRYSPDFIGMKRRLLARPTDFYLKLSKAYLESSNRTSDALGKSVDARLELAKLQLEGGGFEEAERNLRQVLESIDESQIDLLLDDPWLYRSALALSNLASIQRKLGKAESAKETLSRFAEVKNQLSGKRDLPAAIDVVLIENDMAASLEHANRREKNQAEKFAIEATNRMESLVARFPDNAPYAILHEQLLSDIALNYLRLGDPQTAKSKWEKLLGMMTEALSKQGSTQNGGDSDSAISEALKDPDRFNRQFRLAAVHFNLGDVAMYSGEMQQARKYHEQSLTLRKKLAEELPLVAEFQWTLAHSYQALARIAQTQNNFAQAIVYQRQGCEIARRLLDTMPASSKCMLELIPLIHQLGHLESEAQNREGAAQAYGEALPLAVQVLAGNPTDEIMRRHRFELAEHLGGIGLLEDRFASAQKHYEQALADAESFATRPDSLPKDRAVFRSILARMVLIAERTGDVDNRDFFIRNLQRFDSSRPELAESNRRLERYRDHGDAPSSFDEFVALANRAQERMEWELALELHRKAFEKQDSLRKVEQANQGLRAARAALRLAAKSPDEASALRAESRVWLDGWLSTIRSDAALSPQNLKVLLRGLLEDPEFYSVRSKDQLATFSESERTSWGDFWSVVAEANRETQ
ncbi:MAG: Serine/threonine-protein kinase PknD [Planctomycetota bacterium]|jgi:serine/threonine protein kinase